MPIFGIHFYRKINDNGADGNYLVNVYTADRFECYEVATIEALKEAAPLRQDEHYFGGVPINEFWNDEDERGDYEQVIPLIDAYNTLQSDRVNDKEQFVDAVLALHGFSMETGCGWAHAGTADQAGSHPAHARQKNRWCGLSCRTA